MADAFHSARLTYRAFENNDEDTAFIHSLRLDSQSRANGEHHLFKPVNKANSAKLVSRFRDEDFLGVLICLHDQCAESEEKTTEQITKLIGRISLKTDTRGTEHHRAADIGIVIAAEYQRKGYGSEAIKWILEWAFKYGGLHRVGIQCFSYNPGARRLYERLGFVFEGANREALWYDGGWHDHLFLSMLEDEWREKVQQEKSLLSKEYKPDSTMLMGNANQNKF